MTDVVDTHGDRSPWEVGVAERTKLANLFAAIGNATNETIQDMPEFSDEGVRRQMMHTLAAVGGFVTLDLIAHPLARTRLVLPCQWHAAIIDSPSPQARR